MEDLAYQSLEDYQRAKEQALAHPISRRNILPNSFVTRKNFNFLVNLKRFCNI